MADKIIDAILFGSAESFDSAEKQNPEAIDMILGVDKVNREFSPKGNEISTVTGKPVVEWTPTMKPSTSFGALVKSGFVDDPIGKIKIFAEARGIPVGRYSIQDGEIIYQDDDGKWYPETKNTIGGKLREIVGESPAFIPSGILGGVGATVGPGSAFMGAAGGEGLRQYIGDKMTGTETDPKSGLLKMLLAGGEGLLGSLSGFAGKKAINAAGAKRGGILAAHAGRNRSLIDIDEARALESLGRDVGIDLYPPQTTGSKALADKFNLLGDMETSSPIIQAGRKRQYEQIHKSVYDFLDDISPEVSEGAVGRRLKNASTEIIDAADTSRTAKASVVYEKAFNEAEPVDVMPVINNIRRLKSDLPESGSKARTLINKIEGMLTKKGEDGPVPQTDIRVIDNIKKEIDVMLKGPEGESIHKDIKRRLVSIKDGLVKQADKASPQYKEARELYGNLSPAVDKLKTSKIGDLSRLNKEKTLEEASKKLFSNVGSSPESITYAKRMIRKSDPDAWDAALRVHIQDLFEKTKSSAGGVDATTNIGGNFYKRTWGDPKQRKILKAAMDPGQYDYFKKLSTVLNRAGMILRKESATATRTEMIDEIGGSMLRRTVRAATRPLYTKERVVGDWLVKANLGRNAKILADAMVSKRAANQLNKMYQLSPRSERLLPMLSTFISVLSGGQLATAHRIRAGEDQIKEGIKDQR